MPKRPVPKSRRLGKNISELDTSQASRSVESMILNSIHSVASTSSNRSKRRKIDVEVVVNFHKIADTNKPPVKPRKARSNAYVESSVAPSMSSAGNEVLLQMVQKPSSSADELQKCCKWLSPPTEEKISGIPVSLFVRNNGKKDKPYTFVKVKGVLMEKDGLVESIETNFSSKRAKWFSRRRSRVAIASN